MGKKKRNKATNKTSEHEPPQGSEQNQPNTESKQELLQGSEQNQPNAEDLQQEPLQGSEQNQPNTDEPQQDSEQNEPNTEDDGMKNFHLELPSAENADSSSSEEWHTGHEENYAAEVKARTLLGSLVCQGTEPSSVREKDIYQILVLNEITDVEALYKVSRQRFVLIFGSEDSALKCRGAELSAVSGDVRTSLLFAGSDLRFGRRKRAPTFVTLFLPEYISCKAVELAFSNFGEVDRVFYGTHKFNRTLRNGKRHVRIFPCGGDPRTLPRRITFSDGVSRDVLYRGKIVNCYRCNTRHGLGDDCARVVGSDTDVPLPEQSSPPRDPTPLPNEISATDETSTVVDEHQKDQVESRNDPHPSPNDHESDSQVSGSCSLEEGEIRNDSAFSLQKIDNNSPPRKVSPPLNPFRNVPTPKQEHYNQTLFRSSFKLKRIYRNKVCAEMIKYFGIPDNNKQCFTFAFHSALKLIPITSIPKYYQQLEHDCDLFYEKFNWNLSPDIYQAYLVNLVELTSGKWASFLTYQTRDSDLRKTAQK